MHTIDGAVQYSVGKKGFLSGNLHSPSSLCQDSKGNIIVADNRNDRVVRYRAETNMKTCDTILSLYRPLCVAIDKSDHLIVVTAKSISVYEYDIRRAPVAYHVPALIDGVL